MHCQVARTPPLRPGCRGVRAGLRQCGLHVEDLQFELQASTPVRASASFAVDPARSRTPARPVRASPTASHNGRSSLAACGSPARCLSLALTALRSSSNPDRDVLRQAMLRWDWVATQH